MNMNSVTVCLCKQHIAQHCGDSDNSIRVSKPWPQGQRVRLCLHVRPKQGEVCFTVSGVVVVISHP